MTPNLHDSSDGGDAEFAPSRHGLTFDWNESVARQRLRLAGFIFMAVVLHAVFFYIFRVMYPASERSLPMPSRVLLLSDSDPTVRAVLAEVEDRTAAYDPSLSTTGGSIRLADYTTYEPSFSDHEPQLKSPPITVADRLPLPDALRGKVILPKAAPLRSPERPRQILPEGPTEPVLALLGGLANRHLLQPPDLSSIFSEDTDAVATFTMGVNASGVVQYCLPDEDFQADQSEALRRAQSQADQLEALRRALYQLRFRPDPAAGLTWGFVTVEW